jgi:dipeptidyl aminopeptidase/acylaminoacyl peptidase
MVRQTSTLLARSKRTGIQWGEISLGGNGTMLAPLTPEDILRFAIPTSFALSPDGMWVVYAVQTADAERDQRTSTLWLLDVAHSSGVPRKLTSGAHRDLSPQWSPDGEWIAFLSDREHGQQVWVLPTAGGEPTRLTRLRHGASQPRWAPDGRALLFLADVRPDEDPLQPTPEDAAAREREAKREATRLRHITRLQFRWDGADISEGRQHIWRVAFDPVTLAAGGELPTPEQITSGDFDHLDPVWSPDGTQIAFVSDRAAERDANRTDDVWVQDLATGEVTRVTQQPCENHAPAWGADGRLAWFCAPVAPDASFSNTHLWLAERAGDGWHTWDALAGQDVSVGAGMGSDLAALPASPPVWSADGHTIYLTAHARGVTNIHRVDLTEGTLVSLTQGAWQFGPLALAPDGALIALATDTDRPADLVRCDVAADATCTWLTQTNPWLRERACAVPEEFTYTTSDGWHMQGWVMWPTAREAGSDVPAILHIHGGPHGSYGPCYHAQRQQFIGAGYAVIFVNPRGSVGYGQTFARACDRDWGGADYHDIMAGLDAALAGGGIAPDRLAVTGVSYGGYMTNWIIGHTERFKAAVTINSVSNLTSSFGTSDVDAVFGVVEQGGTPWERRDWYLERSPVTYAERITTPTRVIGAERDWRCPIEQSEQMYTALRYFNRAPTDFLRVPGASHSIRTGTPGQHVAWCQAILEWIARFNPPQ